MSMNNFLSFLQQLLTMIDNNDERSIELAKVALQSVVTLAKTSGKADAETLRAMKLAEMNFMHLVMHKDDFSGTPGNYKSNEMKRQRLKHMVSPGC